MSSKKASKKRASSDKRRWVSRVTTESTYPPEGLFTKDPKMIVRQLPQQNCRRRGRDQI